MKVAAHPLLVAVALGMLNPSSLEEESAQLEVSPEEVERAISGLSDEDDADARDDGDTSEG